MMNRVILHHSGGRYVPNPLDIRSYHGLVDGDGQRVKGKFDVLDNAPGRIRKGHYAAHTWKLNTGSIGRCIAAMYQGEWADPYGGLCPVKPVQVDALVLWVVDDVREWDIPVTREHVLSHAEVQITLGVTQRNKWDFDYGLRGGAGRDPVAIGDEFRQEVLLKLGYEFDVKPVLLVQGAVGSDVRLVQSKLGIHVDGEFGPNTHAAVVRFQKGHGLLPDGKVGEMTWAELLR